MTCGRHPRQGRLCIGRPASAAAETGFFSCNKALRTPSYLVRIKKHPNMNRGDTMRRFLVLCLLAGLLQGCAASEEKPNDQAQPGTAPATAPSDQPPATAPSEPPNDAAPAQPDAGQSQPRYENDRFQDVTVKKTKEDTFEVKGKARVFEGVVHYVVEDGHNELAAGVTQASAGGPEWGAFHFTLSVKKENPNTSLTLILFEESAKDGSRTMELPVPLP